MTRPRTPIGGQDRDESSQVDADRRRAARPGCASSIQVNHDYDPEVDFAALRTFDWLPQPRPAGGGVRAALQRNSLLDSRVKKAVNGQLAAKGMAQSDHADLLLAYHTGSRNKVDVTDWG